MPTTDLERFFNDVVALTPSLASYLGQRSSDDKFENSLGPEYTAKYDALLAKYASRKNKLSSTVEDRVLAWTLDDEAARAKFRFELMPMTSFENMVLNLLFQERELYAKASPESAESRHRDMALKIDQAVENMREGMKRGLVVPRRIAKKMLASTEAATELVPGTEWATARLIAFLKKEYVQACPPKALGYCDLPGGKAMYKHLVRSNTTLPLSPEEVHAYGVEEVSRLKKAFTRLSKSMFPMEKMALGDFYARVMLDPREYLQGTKETLQAYRRVRARVQKTFKANFEYVLKKDYEIKAVSKDMESTSPAAFYMPSTYDQSYTGTFYVNARDPLGNPLYSMYALSLHEGFHHYQFQCMVEKKVPAHMIYFVDSVAYTEGIALYAEGLGDYDDDRERFGAYVMEMLRAVRLVVDTGVHWYGWSWKKSLAYMVKHLPLPRADLETELERYVCLPGQALCYSIGRRTFVELRDAFLRDGRGSIRDFHTLLLEDGVLPLQVLKEKLASH